MALTYLRSARVGIGVEHIDDARGRPTSLIRGMTAVVE
jgi:hypothetical protein